MRTTIEVAGRTYEGRWLRDDPRLLHVRGPMESRPVWGHWDAIDDEWNGGPTGRPDSTRTLNWWRAAHQFETTIIAYRESIGLE